MDKKNSKTFFVCALAAVLAAVLLTSCGKEEAAVSGDGAFSAEVSEVSEDSAEVSEDVFEESSQSSEESQEEGISFEIEGDVLTVTGNGAIPESYFVYAEEKGELLRSFIKTVIIEDGVTTVGGFAFRGFGALTYVQLPQSVTSIERYAFENCVSLKSVNIPDGVESVGYDAFGGCRSLKSVSLPASVTYVGGNVFPNCPSLTEIKYGGTREQWKTYFKDCFFDAPEYSVFCTDGKITQNKYVDFVDYGVIGEEDPMAGSIYYLNFSSFAAFDAWLDEESAFTIMVSDNPDGASVYEVETVEDCRLTLKDRYGKHGLYLPMINMLVRKANAISVSCYWDGRVKMSYQVDSDEASDGAFYFTFTFVPDVVDPWSDVHAYVNSLLSTFPVYDSETKTIKDVKAYLRRQDDYRYIDFVYEDCHVQVRVSKNYEYNDLESLGFVYLDSSYYVPPIV